MPSLTFDLSRAHRGSVRTTLVALVALIASGTLAACAAASRPINHMAAMNTAVALPRDLPSFDVPMAAYELSGADLYTMQVAELRLADRCMATFGFTSTRPPLDRDLMLAEQAESTARLYGIDSLQEAQTSGYQPTVVPGASQAGQMAAGSPAYELVFTGNASGSVAPPQGGWRSPGSFGGLEVPAGGCLGQARTILWGSPDSQVKDELAQSLRINAYQEAEADPRIQALFAQWSECMARKGFQLQSPMDPKFGRLPDARPSAAEISTAVADVTCKKAINLAASWNAVDVEYQDKAIEKNQLALTAELGVIKQGLAKAVNQLNARS